MVGAEAAPVPAEGQNRRPCRHSRPYVSVRGGMAGDTRDVGDGGFVIGDGGGRQMLVWGDNSDVAVLCYK